MADTKTTVHIGENSPEQVAYKLTNDVLNADNAKRTGQLILETYFRCLRTVWGHDPRK